MGLSQKKNIFGCQGHNTQWHYSLYRFDLVSETIIASDLINAIPRVQLSRRHACKPKHIRMRKKNEQPKHRILSKCLVGVVGSPPGCLLDPSEVMRFVSGNYGMYYVSVVTGRAVISFQRRRGLDKQSMMSSGSSPPVAPVATRDMFSNMPRTGSRSRLLK